MRGAWARGLAWLRVLLLLSYPIVGAAIAFYVVAFSDQGIDLLLASLDVPSGWHWIPAIVAAFSVVIAAFSIWAPARLLCRRSFVFFPIDAEATGWLREHLPRILGATSMVGVAIGYGRLAWRFGSAVAWFATGFWLVATFAFYALLVGRRRILKRAAGDSRFRDARAMQDSLPPRDVGWTVIACIAFVVVSLLFAAFPVVLPRLFGGTALVLLGVGALTFIVTMTLAYLPLAKGQPTLTVVGAALVLLFSTWLDNHPMRPADLEAAGAVALPPTLRPADRASRWQQARAQAPCRGTQTKKLFVAAAGGGIRAAYWTARVLEELSQQVGSDFDCALFALSGVSGGSLGVAAYAAARPGLDTSPADGHVASAALGEDFLAPAVAGLLFYDAVQRVVPWPFAWLDRSRGLEEAFSQAFDGVAGRPFRQPLRALDARSPAAPIVFLNATVVEDGRRAIQSNLDLSDFLDVHDLDCARRDAATRPSTAAISLASAVHNSARFTYVSPAGRVDGLQDDASCDGSGHDARIVDGGYFENSGAATLVQLLCALQACDRADPQPDATPVLLLIRNSPGTEPYCEGGRADAHCLSLSASPKSTATPSLSRFLPEVTSPFRALLAAREQRERLAVVAAAELFRRRGGFVVEAYLPLDRRLPDPPLGWSLSKGVQGSLDTQARQIVAGCGNALRVLFAGGTPPSRCDDPGVARAAAGQATAMAVKGASSAASEPAPARQ